MDKLKLYIFHTGKVRVDRAIPLHERDPLAVTGLFRGKAKPMILPVSAYMELCAQGASTLTERLEIIGQQKENAYRQIAEFQKKIDHLEWKEQHYRDLLQTGAEDDCNPLERKGT